MHSGALALPNKLNSWFLEFLPEMEEVGFNSDSIILPEANEVKLFSSVLAASPLPTIGQLLVTSYFLSVPVCADAS